MEPHIRDQVVDYVRTWSEKTEVSSQRIIKWLAIGKSKYHNWRRRYGKVNEHNGLVPRDFWLEDWERQAIIDFYYKNPLSGYRRLTYQMIDTDIVAVSASTVYRVLRAEGLLDRWNRKPSKKGTGFVHPLKAHEHWHVDISYINVQGTFYYLCVCANKSAYCP